MGELALSGVQGDLFSPGLKAEVNNPDRRLRSYMPTCFAICPLPVRSMKSDVKEYVKRYNGFELRLIGTNGIPGGKVARDMLMLFTTEAVYRKGYIGEGEKIKLSFKSLSELQRSIGMNSANHGDRLLDMLEIYSGCSIYFQFDTRYKFDGQSLLFDSRAYKGVRGYGEKDVTLTYKGISNVPFINKLERIDMIKSKCKKGEPVAIDVVLASDFVDTVADSAVSVDFTVYREIASALAQDLYVWLLYKMYNFKNTQMDEVFISKGNLIEQFGMEGDSNENMKYSRILESLDLIKRNYYEDLKYEVVDKGKRREKGIILRKSPLVIKRDDVRYVPLLTTRSF